MLQKSDSILTSGSTNLWKGPDICLILSEGAQKCALACVSPHAQLLPSGAAHGGDGLGVWWECGCYTPMERSSV